MGNGQTTDMFSLPNLNEMCACLTTATDGELAVSGEVLRKWVLAGVAGVRYEAWDELCVVEFARARMLDTHCTASRSFSSRETTGSMHLLGREKGIRRWRWKAPVGLNRGPAVSASPNS